MMDIKRKRNNETEEQNNIYQRASEDKEASCGGFHYRWEYDKHMKSSDIKERSFGIKGLIISLIVLIFALIGLLSFIIFNVMTDRVGNVSDSSSQGKNTEQNGNIEYSDIYEMSKEWVVHLKIETSAGVRYGTGVMITSDGYIVTDRKLMYDEIAIEAELYDGSAFVASFVGEDISSNLAVLKINEASSFNSVSITDPKEKISVGMSVAVIGSTNGEKKLYNMENGIISAYDTEYASQLSISTPDIAFTNAEIGENNLGGPVLSSAGNIVGIVVSPLSEVEDYSGVICPLVFVTKTVEVIIDNADSENSDDLDVIDFYGIVCKKVTEETSELHNIPAGYIVDSIVQNDIARESGLRIGDVIFKVNGDSIATFTELDKIDEPDSSVTDVSVVVYRDGQQIELKII